MMEKKRMITDILEKMHQDLTSEDAEKIQKAYEFAFQKHEGKKRLTGEDFILHPLEVAYILADLNCDPTTICAALLHEVMNEGATFEEMSLAFGEEIALILQSVFKINKLELPDNSEASAIYLRKVLVGMAEDVRVLFIKLADRLHNMRTSSVLSLAKQKKTANETMSVLVPIAHRLGINSIKSELENLSLYYLKRDVYDDILKRLNASQEELKDVLEEMQMEISNILIEHNIHFYIKSRVKSVYSIYNKLNHGKKWSSIYDILALRIIVENVSDCYTAIGLIHAKYRPIPGRFKDYIAMPKENMYQSLHTGVFGADGHRFEVQIRTWEMDELAEKGIASHWSYKEKGTKKVQNMMEQKLEMFRSLIESNQEESDSDFADSVKNDFLSDFIYVFTPKGDVVELPKGATPVDFAYRIHSDIGDQMVGCLVNDNIVPLNYQLEDNDIVKIKTNSNSTPSKEWLQFVKTGQAKNKIKAFFSKQDRDYYVNKGKSILESAIRKKKLAFDEVLNTQNIKKICEDLKLRDLDDIYFVVGNLRYTPLYIIHLTEEDKKNVQDLLIEKVTHSHSFERKNYKNEIIVAGSGDILANLAKCCNPVYGDPIKGYVTKGEGVSVHLSTCPNILNKSNRLIEVAWNDACESSYLADLQISTMSDKNYLLDLIAKATSKNINVHSVRTKELDSKIIYEFTLKVKSCQELEQFMDILKSSGFVLEVKRK